MKYTRKQKSKKEKKKKTKTIEALPLEQFLSIGVCGCGGDFDDKAEGKTEARSAASCRKAKAKAVQ